MFRPGRRLFSIACVLLILVALAHTAGHFSPPPVDDPAFDAMDRAMKGYVIPMGSMSPSFFDVVQSLSLTMTVTLLLLGALGLATAGAADAGDAGDALIRRLALVYLVGTAALVAVFALYRIPPPLFTLAAVAVTFLLAVVVPARRRS